MPQTQSEVYLQQRAAQENVYIPPNISQYQTPSVEASIVDTFKTYWEIIKEDISALPGKGQEIQGYIIVYQSLRDQTDPNSSLYQSYVDALNIVYTMYQDWLNVNQAWNDNQSMFVQIANNLYTKVTGTGQILTTAFIYFLATGGLVLIGTIAAIWLKLRAQTQALASAQQSIAIQHQQCVDAKKSGQLDDVGFKACQDAVTQRQHDINVQIQNVGGISWWDQLKLQLGSTMAYVVGIGGVGVGLWFSYHWFKKT